MKTISCERMLAIKKPAIGLVLVVSLLIGAGIVFGASPAGITVPMTATPTFTPIGQLRLQYQTGETSAVAAQIKPYIKISNSWGGSARLNGLKIRYWYTAEGSQPQSFTCESATFGCAYITGIFGTVPPGVNGADSYLEIGLNDLGVYNDYLPVGSEVEIRAHFAKNDFTNYTQDDDYSFDASKTAYAEWSRITMYYNGVLLWGVEPPGLPTRTPTPSRVPPTPYPTCYTGPTWTPGGPTATGTPPGWVCVIQTATASVSPTPTPTVQTPTPTRTNTAPTPTRTRTATRTATAHVTATPSGPATATPSLAPALLKVQYKCAAGTASANQIKPHFNIVNGGSTAVALSDLKVRYFYTIDGEKAQNYYCDYAVVGCRNVTGAFVKLASAAAGADYYLEIGFKGGTLAAGGQTGEIQNRFAKSDWTNYTQTGDYSFDPSKTSFADWDKVALYRNGALIWGTSPITVNNSTATPTPTPRPSATGQTPTRTPTSGGITVPM